MVIQQAVRQAAAYLKKEWQSQQYNNAPLDAQIILCHVLGIDRIELVKNYDQAIDQHHLTLFNQLIHKRAKHMPLQYIVGRQEFMSLPFEVNSNVLIPRPDTEIVTQCVIDFCKTLQQPTVMDIGCGCGCIGISVAHYVKGCRVFSVDISEGALEVARRNAEALEVNVKFMRHDILKSFPSINSKLDVIVSNPPYIKSQELQNLQPEVRLYEPHSALDGGQDGLVFYRAIIKHAQHHLKSGGLLAFETDFEFLDEAHNNQNFKQVTAIKDLSALPRVLTLIKKADQSAS